MLNSPGIKTESFLNLKKLDEVFAQTLQAVESGKGQISEIMALTNKEAERARAELELLKSETVDTIAEVDKLEVAVKRSRLTLMEVHRDFHSFTEAQVRNAYQAAQDIQIELALLREKERMLRHKRDELELHQREIHAAIEKAEILSVQITKVIEFLSGSFAELSETLDDLQKKQSMAIRVIQAQEDERKRLSREIHDGPAQSLANIALRLEICEKMMELNPPKAIAEINNLKQVVRGNLREVRDIIFDLRPMSLDDLGLKPALQRYFLGLANENWCELNYSFNGEEQQLPSEYRTAIFRIVQEALCNAKKHAWAKRVDVHISFSAANVDIIINDDGCGFDYERFTVRDLGRNHFGILGIKERTELLSGNFQIKSTLGCGTALQVRIPLPEETTQCRG